MGALGVNTLTIGRVFGQGAPLVRSGLERATRGETVVFRRAVRGGWRPSAAAGRVAPSTARNIACVAPREWKGHRKFRQAKVRAAACGTRPVALLQDIPQNAVADAPSRTPF